MVRKQNWLDASPIVLLDLRKLPTYQGYLLTGAVAGTSVPLPKPMVAKDSMEFTNEKVRQLAREMMKLETGFLSEGRLSLPKN